MIRLKTLLEDIHLLNERQFNSIDHLFYFLMPSGFGPPTSYLPLSIPIIKKMVGNIKTTKVAHVTDLVGYKRLKKLEGKKKGISSFNSLQSKSNILRGFGIATRGGVIVILEGKILINSKLDLYSRTDTQGRNWVKESDLFDGRDRFSMNDYLPMKALEIKSRYEVGMAISGEEKRDYIKMYIDTAYKEMLKRKDIFREKYFSPFRVDVSTGNTWNEIIVAQVKIKEVAFVEDIELTRKGLESKVKIPKNGVIIKDNEVPKFLKKHGIKIT